MVRRKDEDRPVLHDPVEMVARQRLVLADDDVVRLLADDQVIARVLAQVSVGARLQFIEAARAEELEVRQFGGAREQVHVALDEAGHHGAASGVHHAGGSALLRHDFSMSSQAHDSIPGNGNRVGRRASRVHGENGRIGDDERSSHVARGPFQSMPSASIIAFHAGRAVTRPIRRLRLG